MTQVSEIAAVIRRHHFHFFDEYMLQEGLAGALGAAGHEVKREVRIKRGRLDLLIDGCIGLEVKIACPKRQLERQVTRYLEGDELDGMVVVSVAARHAAIAEQIAGKPVEVVTLGGGAL
jgi:hypothetical protein